MATTASPKQAIGSVLGSIATAAQSVSGIFDAVSGGIGMANRYVQTASEKQVLATDYEMADYEEQLLDTITVERARAKREIQRFLDEDQANAAHFNAIYTELQLKVAERRAKREGVRFVRPEPAPEPAADAPSPEA